MTLLSKVDSQSLCNRTSLRSALFVFLSIMIVQGVACPLWRSGTFRGHQGTGNEFCIVLHIALESSVTLEVWWGWGGGRAGRGKHHSVQCTSSSCFRGDGILPGTDASHLVYRRRHLGSSYLRPFLVQRAHAYCCFRSLVKMFLSCPLHQLPWL